MAVQASQWILLKMIQWILLKIRLSLRLLSLQEIEPGAPSHPEAAQVAASSVLSPRGSPSSFGFREVFFVIFENLDLTNARCSLNYEIFSSFATIIVNPGRYHDGLGS